jgi:hypothetical protein
MNQEAISKGQNKIRTYVHMYIQLSILIYEEKENDEWWWNVEFEEEEIYL